MDNSLKSLFDWKKMIVGVLICIAFVGVLGTVFAESSQELSTHFIETFGLWGLFVGALLIDSIPTPGGPLPLLTLCLQGGASFEIVFIVALLGSLGASCLGYTLGRTFGLPNSIENWLQQKYPENFASLKSKGLWGVVVLAALPLPLSVASWVGGSLQIHPKCILYATSMRIPKMILYLSSIQGTLQVIGS